MLSALLVSQASGTLYFVYQGKDIDINIHGKKVGEENVAWAIREATNDADISDPFSLLNFDRMERGELVFLQKSLLDRLSISQKKQLLKRIDRFPVPPKSKTSRLRNLRWLVESSLAEKTPAQLGSLFKSVSKHIGDLGTVHPLTALST